MRIRALAIALLLAASQGQSQGSPDAVDPGGTGVGPVALLTADAARGWEGVGRIDFAGGGFCTGSLIAPDIVLTAAHCLFDPLDGAALATSSMTFRAGLRDKTAVATRAVLRAAPSAARRTADDVALLLLDAPIGGVLVRPLPVGAAPSAEKIPGHGPVGVVSYAHDRAETPALQKDCNLLGEQGGLLILDCDVDFGASGAPVVLFTDGVAQIISIVSAKAELGGKRLALASAVSAPLQRLRAELRGHAPVAPAPRMLGAEGRRDTGARFVRP